MRIIFPTNADFRPSRPCIWIVIIGIACALPMPVAVETQYQAAQADLTELSIEQLLNIEGYSASKLVQKITEARASVSIITAANIKGYLDASGQEIIRINYNDGINFSSEPGSDA